MSSSGSYSWNPDVEDFLTEAWERCGKLAKDLTREHARSARRSLNLLFAFWATRGIHLFTVDQQTQTLTQGDVDYTVASGTLALLECTVRRDSIENPVAKIGREQYEAIPDKTAQGMPSMVYLDRRTGTYYLWNSPENSTDVFRYYRARRIQDVTAAQETLDVGYIWFEALAAGLAWKLAQKWAPDRYAALKAEAEEAFLYAKQEDRERADTTVTVGM